MWFDQFPHVEAVFLLEDSFDHSPILVKNHSQVGGRHPFKYFHMCSQDPSFQAKVSSSWSENMEGTQMFRVVQKLKKVKNALKNLNKDDFQQIHISDARGYQNLLNCEKLFNKIQLWLRIVNLSYRQQLNTKECILSMFLF